MKKKVLFVGAFNKSAGAKGGQLYACTTLVESDLSKFVEWILIDSTATTNMHRSFVTRLYRSSMRLIRFGLCLIKRPDHIIIFVADRASLLEKGTMTFLALIAGRPIILCPRSGLLMNDITKSMFWRWYVRATFAASRIVVCQSDIWRNFFLREISHDSAKFIVISNWIDARDYVNIHNFDIPSFPQSFRVLFVGWLTKEKGILDLVKSAALLEPGEYEFIIAGEGPDKHKAIQLAQILKIRHPLKFIGWIGETEKRELFADSNVLILPSYYEGLPNIILEAMLSGIPVIATNVGGIPDLITHGRSGLLVSPGSPSDLAQSILSLRNNPQVGHSLAQNARQTIIESHSLSIAVEAFKALIQ